MARDEWLLIGRVAGPFGVGGEAKVEPYTDFPDRFRPLAELYLGADHRPVTVDRARQHKGHVLIKLAGVETPEQVREFAQQEIFVPRSEARTLPPGHFYLDDAVGLHVVTTDGRPVGRVVDVLRTGSNEVFVVRASEGDVLVPVIKDAIGELDVEGRRVTVEPWALGEE